MKKRRGEAEGGRRKKQRNGVGSFLEVEAQEDEAEAEEDLEEYGDDENGGFLDDTGEAAEAAEMAISYRRRLEEEMGQTEGRGRAGNLYYSTIGQLEKRYGAADGREGGNGAEGLDDDDEYEPGEEDYISEGEYEYANGLDRLLPGGEWKLWKIRTIRPGVEREACIAILRKYNSERNKDAFLIASAFASDSVKGSVYVEAPSQGAIQKHLSDIRLLFTNSASVQRVPAKEMADVFQMDARRDELPRIGEWVRILRGPYAGDIALVSELDEGNGTLTVRTIPRIDLSYEQRLMERDEDGGDSTNIILPTSLSKNDRPASRRILVNELESYRIEFERPSYFTDCVKFRNYLLEEKTGFLLRTVKPTAISREAKPSAEELARFLEPGIDLSELVNSKVSTIISTNIDESYVIGQPVKIIAGDLSGLKGIVCGRDLGGELRIQTYTGAVPPGAPGGPSHSGAGSSSAPSQISVLSENCLKEFRIGDSVRIIGGIYSGESGLITCNRDIYNSNILLTDRHEQICVENINICIGTSDTSSNSGISRLDGYSIGDFISLSGNNNAGIILRISKTKRLDILTKDGNINIDITQISGKHNIKSIKEQDAYNHEFGLGSSVEILEGPHKGIIGTVKHLWKDTAFINIPGSIITIPCANVKLIQHTDNNSNSNSCNSNSNSNYNSSSQSNNNNLQQNHRPRGQIGFRTQFILMGTQVKLIAGPHKGLYGELRGIQGSEAKVLVSAMGAEVIVPKHMVQLLSDSSEAARFFRRPHDGGGGGGYRRRGGPSN